jgi:hypothetical protein
MANQIKRCLAAALGPSDASDPPRGQQHLGRLQAFTARQLADPENAGKPEISAEQPIPNRKDSAEIGVRLVIPDGVVDEVQSRG